MKTKYFVKFLNNSAHLDVDLEVVDILQKAIKNGDSRIDEASFMFGFVDETKHVKLSARAKTLHSRKLAVNHLKSSVREAFIKSIYESTTTYFHEVLKAATRKGINSDRLIGEHSINFTGREIMQLGSYPKILDKISTSIFRALEDERSTKSLIDKMAKKLNLRIDAEKIKAALPYFEIRHKLVHAEGKADKQFCRNYPNIGAEEHKSIRISFDIVDQARVTITELIKEFDQKLVENRLIPESDLQP